MKNIIDIQLPGPLQYYLGTTYRRKILDNHLNTNKHFFSGTVLDIGGGRKRGKFIPPKTKKWIFADITPELNPDIICDVEKMQFKAEEFDTIKATELFEHVESPEKGLRECFRVLKQNGHLIISAPFIYPVHGDPYDYQRWTEYKWNSVLQKTGFQVKKIIPTGLFFTVLADMLKRLNRELFLPLRFIGYLFYPIIDMISLIDSLNFVSKNKNLSAYTTGYLIILKK